MDNVTICIIVVVVVLFLAVIYVYKDLSEQMETLEKEQKDMETRYIDEISDLKRVANKAASAAAAATAASTSATLAANSAKEGLTVSMSSGHHKRGPPMGPPARGAPLRALGAPGLPEGFRAAISLAQEKGISQDHNMVAQEMFDPTKAKTVSPATAAAMTPKSRPPVPDGSGMEEAPMPQIAAPTSQIPQMFTQEAQGPPPAVLPGVNYEAISDGFADDQNFVVDAFDFSLGDPNAELYLT